MTSSLHTTGYDSAVQSQGNLIFIVDDEPDIRDLIAETLGDEGYCVRTFEDGLLALAELEYRLPSLLLLDLMMPRISGWEVMQQIRRNPFTANLPVVLISASREMEDARETLGANACLAKPFDLEQLLDLVLVYAGSRTN